MEFFEIISKHFKVLEVAPYNGKYISSLFPPSFVYIASTTLCIAAIKQLTNRHSKKKEKCKAFICSVANRIFILLRLLCLFLFFFFYFTSLYHPQFIVCHMHLMTSIRYFGRFKNMQKIDDDNNNNKNKTEAHHGAWHN